MTKQIINKFYDGLAGIVALGLVACSSGTAVQKPRFSADCKYDMDGKTLPSNVGYNLETCKTSYPARQLSSGAEVKNRVDECTSLDGKSKITIVYGDHLGNVVESVEFDLGAFKAKAEVETKAEFKYIPQQ